MPALTEEQRVVLLQYIPRVPAALSIVGSSLILVSILSRRGSLCNDVYQRMMLCLSVYDLVGAIWTVMGSIPVPEEYGIPGSRGNLSICSLQGFFIHGSVIATNLYNAAVVLYFLLKVRYNVQDTTITKCFEPVTHGLALVLSLAFALTGQVQQVFNPIGFGGPSNSPLCYIQAFPPGCDFVPDMECTRGANASSVIWYIAIGPFLVSTLVLLVSLGLVLLTVIQKARQSQRYQFESLIGRQRQRLGASIMGFKRSIQFRGGGSVTGSASRSDDAFQVPPGDQSNSNGASVVRNSNNNHATPPPAETLRNNEQDEKKPSAAEANIKQQQHPVDAGEVTEPEWEPSALAPARASNATLATIDTTTTIGDMEAATAKATVATTCCQKETYGSTQTFGLDTDDTGTIATGIEPLEETDDTFDQTLSERGTDHVTTTSSTTACNSALARRQRRRRNNTARRSNTDKMVLVVGQRCLVYGIVFLNTFIWTSISMIIHNEEPPEWNSFWLGCLAFIFMPIQGFLNFLIYISPRYNRLRSDHADKSRFWALTQSIYCTDSRAIPYTSSRSRVRSTARIP